MHLNERHSVLQCTPQDELYELTSVLLGSCEHAGATGLKPNCAGHVKSGPIVLEKRRHGSGHGEPTANNQSHKDLEQQDNRCKRQRSSRLVASTLMAPRVLVCELRSLQLQRACSDAAKISSALGIARQFSRNYSRHDKVQC